MDKEDDYKNGVLFRGELSYLFRLKKNSKILLCLIGLIVIIAALIIIISYYQKNISNKSSKGDNISNEHILNNRISFIGNKRFFGKILNNLAYGNDGKIENSFKIEGYNHIDGVDNINDNKDYKKNEKNMYNLYIPQYAIDRMKDYNGIFLWIHGGAWISGNKESMDIYCKLISEQGYISATLDYTLLKSHFKKFNIFKNIDEITSCIKAIKNKLINLGFNENKLYLAIGGYSAGAHLSLLYSYLNSKIDIIPIKFIVNFVGPIGLYPKYFYKLKSKKETLSNIEEVSLIEEAMKNGTVVPLDKEIKVLQLMNMFSGNKFTDSLDEMILSNNTINWENEKFKEMFKIVKNAFVTEITDKHKLPTICIYGGIDDVIGVTTYAYLKQKMDKDERKYDFIYSRYEGHNIIRPHTTDGKLK